MQTKSSVEDIRRRFDNDVERFSNLNTGQSSTVDAPLVLELLVSAAAVVNPSASSVLDVGCGAGNYTLKLLQRLPELEITLLDLSLPMLERAVERIQQAHASVVTPIQGDIREAVIGIERYDIIMAAAVFHHLRSDAEWEAVFEKTYRALKPGGSLWISDFISHELPAVQAQMWQRYGDYLTQLKDDAYRRHVFAYVEKEDTPRSLPYQLELLRRSGFKQVEVLHKNNCFAAFGGIKT